MTASDEIKALDLPSSDVAHRLRRVLLTLRRRHGRATYDIWRHDLVRRLEQRLTDYLGVAVTRVQVDSDRVLVFATDRYGAVPSVFRKARDR